MKNTWIYVNIYNEEQSFVFNQNDILDRIKENFTLSNSEKIDLLQLELEKLHKFVTSLPLINRIGAQKIYDQLKHRHDEEGPTYESLIEIDGVTVRCLIAKYAISFEGKETEFSKPICEQLICFVKTLLPKDLYGCIQTLSF